MAPGVYTPGAMSWASEIGDLFVDPRISAAIERDQFLIAKKQRHLFVAVLGRVRSVDQIAPDLDSKITTNSPWRRLGRVRRAHGTTHNSDHIFTGHDRDYHRPRDNIFNKAVEERLTLVNR